MKGSLALLKRHFVWIAAGFLLALVAELIVITIAVSQESLVSRTTLALVTFGSFALTAGVHLVVTLRTEEPEPIRTEASRMEQDRLIAA